MHTCPGWWLPWAYAAAALVSLALPAIVIALG